MLTKNKQKKKGNVRDFLVAQRLRHQAFGPSRECSLNPWSGEPRSHMLHTVTKKKKNIISYKKTIHLWARFDSKDCL